MNTHTKQDKDSKTASICGLSELYHYEYDLLLILLLSLHAYYFLLP